MERKGLTILTLIAIVESNNNPFATRTEREMLDNPADWVKDQYGAVWKYNNFMLHDEIMITLCTSFGAYQVLGATLYGCGYSDQIGSFFQNSVTQTEFHVSFLRGGGFDPYATLLSMSDAECLKLAAYQNGPGNPQAYYTALIGADTVT